MFPFSHLPLTGPVSDDPPIPPAGDEYIAIGLSPGLKILTKEDDTFTDLGPAPSGWPASAVLGVSWHPSEALLAAAVQFSGLSFFAIVDGAPVAVTPGTTGITAAREVSWSPNGQYLAVGLTSAPYLAVYRYVSGVLTKMTDPASMPTAAVRRIVWSDDGTRFVTSQSGGTNTSYLFSVSGATYSYIGGYLAGNAFDMATYDDIMVQAAGTTPYARAVGYGSGKNSIALNGSLSVPKPSSTTATAVAFNKDGTLFASCAGTSATLATFNGTAFTSLGNVSTGAGNRIAFTRDDMCMISLNSSPYIYLARNVGGVITPVTPTAGIFTGTVQGIAVS